MSVLLPKPDLVIFDWDDTLVDNYAAIHAAINAARAAFGQPEWSLAETRSQCRLALREIFPVWFGAEWEKAQEIFYKTFAERHIELLKIKTGSDDLLAALQARKVKLAVNSNKNARYLRAEINHLKWDHYFGKVVGAGDVPHGKPAPDGVNAIRNHFGTTPEQTCWYVGDNDTDAATAAAGGCFFVQFGVPEDAGAARFSNAVSLMNFL